MDKVTMSVQEMAMQMGISPVSYTHLDVYKRQVYLIVEFF